MSAVARERIFSCNRPVLISAKPLNFTPRWIAPVFHFDHGRAHNFKIFNPTQSSRFLIDYTKITSNLSRTHRFCASSVHNTYHMYNICMYKYYNPHISTIRQLHINKIYCKIKMFLFFQSNKSNVSLAFGINSCYNCLLISRDWKWNTMHLNVSWSLFPLYSHTVVFPHCREP